MKRILLIYLFSLSSIFAQETTYFFVEGFDSASPPLLPRGWSSTLNRLSTGDFVTTASSVHSAPYTVLSTNATISQSLTSPEMDFSNCNPEKLEFYSSRSSTHTAGLLVEASLDDGVTFPLALTDTIRNPGISNYVLTSLQLPSSLANQSRVRIRWRLVGYPAGGTSGTFRLDDISISSHAETPEMEPRALVINEIMYEPLLGQNEWIELYHRGASPVDIGRWRLSDRPTSSGVNAFTITNGPLLVQPREFVVIAADSTILSQFSYLTSTGRDVHLFILNRSGGLGLNNDGDDVIVRDAAGRTIDSVSYSPSWHHPDVIDPKGRSLERVNPDLASNDRRNWSTSPSPSGGTPGKVNGIYTTTLPTSASVSFHPNPFSPDGDGFEDFCIIRYNLPLTTALIRITIFDIKGRLLRTLANCELSGSHGEVVWDGLDDSKQRVRIGCYIVFVESIDGEGGILATAKGVVVVATKL
jgi:hypothetical protein